MLQEAIHGSRCRMYSILHSTMILLAFRPCLFFVSSPRSLSVANILVALVAWGIAARIRVWEGKVGVEI